MTEEWQNKNWNFHSSSESDDRTDESLSQRAVHKWLDHFQRASTVFTSDHRSIESMQWTFDRWVVWSKTRQKWWRNLWRALKSGRCYDGTIDLGIKKNIIVIITINIIILNTMIVTITWPKRTNTAWQYCLVTHSLRGPFIYSESCLSSYILYRSSIAWSFAKGSARKENFTLFFQMNLQR